MKAGDLIIGLVGLATLTGALFYVKTRHEDDVVIKRPAAVPVDAGTYGADNSWIRCLNTNDATVFNCEIYRTDGELVYKGAYQAPTVPTLPLIIKGADDKAIAVKDQVGHRFYLQPKL